MHRNAVPPTAHLPPPAKTGTVLAFDFGEKRIGMAVGDTEIGIAHPLATITAPNKQQRYASIRELVMEWRPSFLVVGLPAHMDGTEHEVSKLARKFARELGTRFGLPVELVDERLTSVEAQASMIAAGISSRKRKLLVDQVAAQHILQAYLDSRARTS